MSNPGPDRREGQKMEPGNQVIEVFLLPKATGGIAIVSIVPAHLLALSGICDVMVASHWRAWKVSSIFPSFDWQEAIFKRAVSPPRQSPE